MSRIFHSYFSSSWYMTVCYPSDLRMLYMKEDPVQSLVPRYQLKFKFLWNSFSAHWEISFCFNILSKYRR